MLQVSAVLAVAIFIFTVVLRWTFRNEEEKNEAEVFAGVVSPRDGSMAVDFEGQFSNFTPVAVVKDRHQCAVCFSVTSTRCSRCKAVRYCSSKCQIVHWRQGHKYECHPQGPSEFEREYVNENTEITEQCKTNHTDSAEDLPTSDEKNRISHLHHDVLDSAVPRLSTVKRDSLDLDTHRMSSGDNRTPLSDISAHDLNQEENKSDTLVVNTPAGLASTVKKMNRENSRQNDRRKSRSSHSDGRKDHSLDRGVSGGINSSHSKEGRFVDNEDQKHSQTVQVHAKSLSRKQSGSSSLLASRNSSSSSQLPHNGFKSSLQKVVHHFKASHQKKPPLHDSLLETSDSRNFKAGFDFDAFMKLYCSNEVELRPFGLTNCGNSCYANAVLQCLAYTRPLTTYLLKGFHSKECWKEEWCFVCELEFLIIKGSEGCTSLSPIRILSNIRHLGHGREEDAHEFLRYAVDTMQSVCVELAGRVGPVAEESTLVGMTFGGYLHSKIKCLKCNSKSEIYEKMMDLSVEIDGDVRTLEQALRRFTASEILEGDNKYYCIRCKSYEKAKKKLTVFQVPNILTIVLKRFQAGNFAKLKKPVQFPEILNMTPYCHSSDKYPRYRLYAVIVHLDVSSAEYSGHYVCYVKNCHEEWFKIDDSVVISVDLKRVLSQEAYMLLYARDSPRPTTSQKNSYDGNRPVVNHRPNPKGAFPKVRHSYSDANVDPLVMQRVSSKNNFGKDASYVEEWVTHSVESIPRVDSSSEVSSLFSYSEEGTCSTTSTKDSASIDEFSDYLFGGGSFAGR